MKIVIYHLAPACVTGCWLRNFHFSKFNFPLVDSANCARRNYAYLIHLQFVRNLILLKHLFEC
jgi:hypothetical protein